VFPSHTLPQWPHSRLYPDVFVQLTYPLSQPIL
jgi:hypothetical protein